ncbi:unnamed protein product [Calicophoron daubneyi]|uniref:nicotinamidase n=1 Tax=Calicophoron daubneyi TaxID=300641 RepID=A0AAV2TDI9_CALDB
MSENSGLREILSSSLIRRENDLSSPLREFWLKNKSMFSASSDLEQRLTISSTAEIPAEWFDVKCPVLLVVDVQHDFVRGTLRTDLSSAGEDAVAIMDPINALLEMPFRKVFVSMDFHPNGHVSFYENRERWKVSPRSPTTNFKEAKIGDSITIIDSRGTEKTQKLWPAHCIANTPGAALYKDLKIPLSSLIQMPEKTFHLIKKGTHPEVESYSVFGNTEGPEDTGFSEQLKNCNADLLVICGIAFDVCVVSTALDAANRGLRVVVVEDACVAISSEAKANAFKEMVSAFIHIAKVDQIPALISGEIVSLLHVAARLNRSHFPAQRREPHKLTPEELHTFFLPSQRFEEHEKADN